MIVVCCILHNLAKQLHQPDGDDDNNGGSDDSENDDDDGDDDGYGLNHGARQLANLPQNDGQATRMHYVNTYF